MGFIETAKEKLSDQGLAIAIGGISGLLVIVGRELAPEVLPILSSPRLQKAVVPILAISLILNALCLIAIFQLSRKPRFQTLFGFLWDSDLQPHCPACEKPMQWGEWAGTNGPGLLCGKCEHPRHLADDFGKPMLIEEARKELRKKK